MALKSDWVDKDTPGKSAADWTFDSAAANLVATQCNGHTSAIAAKYTKPGTGIPASDMATAVQSSLGLADSALQLSTWIDARDYGVTGNGTADDTAELQAWVDAVVTNGGQGWLPNGTYKITDTVAIPSGYGWAIHGENSNDTIISQATANIPVLQIGDTAGWSHSYTLEGLTLTYASAQPSTNTDANCILFVADPANVLDISTTYFAQFRNLWFRNGFYGMKVIADVFSLWGCEFDQLGMKDMSGGFYDSTGALAGPNNRWGRLTLWCNDAIGPIFKQWGDSSTSVAALEFLQADAGPTLIETRANFNADIGSLKLEIGDYPEAGSGDDSAIMFDFTSTHFIRIGDLHVFGTTMTVGDGTTAIRVGYGVGDDRSLLEIGSLRLEASSLTGDCYALAIEGDDPGRIVVDTTYLENGWELCDNVNTEIGNYLNVRSWLNGSIINLGDEDYVVTPGSPNIIRFTAGLSTWKSVTLPDPFGNDVFTGLWYEVIVDGVGNGGWMPKVAQANRADLWAPPADKMKVRYTYYRYAWVLTDVAYLSEPATGYAPTNVTTDRVFDANSTTLDEVADVLGTLIADLKLKGIISA